MKRFTWKLAITIIVAYMLLTAVVLFSYTTISNGFILSQAEQDLTTMGEEIAHSFSLQVTYDYNRFIDEIESLDDPLTEFVPANFSLREQNMLGLGQIVDRDVTIGVDTYTYDASFYLNDFQQNVAIYRFSDAFSTWVGETNLMVFNFDGYIGYFEASSYVQSFFSDNHLIENYYVIGADSRLYFDSSNAYTNEYFTTFFRSAGYSEDYIYTMTNALTKLEPTVIQADLFDAAQLIAFTPITISLSQMTKPLYFATMYERVDVIATISPLTNILWAVFAIIFIIFSIAIVIIYRILSSRIADIDNARLALYFSKPYIIKISRRGKIKGYNRAFRNFLGDFDIYDDVRDFKVKDVVNKESILEMAKRQVSMTFLFELDNEERYVLFIPTRTASGILLIGSDTTNTAGKFDKYRKLALMNSVTDLPNQNQFMQDLDELLDDPERNHLNNALITFDIVNFKKVKLILGQRSSDRFLALVSEMVNGSLDGYPSTLYNVEADHFVILLEGIETYKWVNRWINKVQDIFNKPVTIERNFLTVDFKFGIFNIEFDRYEILNNFVCYDNMMLALKHAKESTRHKQFTYDVSLSIIASREHKMELDLANAIKKNEFRMVLQPQLSNSNNKIIGFEALIRWQNPTYAHESPLKFIRMAEQNGMIIDIGRIALHETFMIAKEMEPYNITLSLNISPVQMLQAGFVSDLIEIFEQYDLKKGSVALEITETFLIDSFELVISKLNLLKKQGFHIHLDDFGTGYSSLQYLRDLPVNALKIDKAFVDEVETDAHARAIVNMISALAKNIDLEVIAEGVETPRQNFIIKKAGCNVIQGYLVSKPVDKQVAIALVKAYNIDHTADVKALLPKKKEARR